MDLKLSQLLLEFGIKGTFYVALHNRELAGLEVSDLLELSKYVEIGAHTSTHPPDLRRLPPSQLEDEICGSKLELEDVLGSPVSMFCYPRGKYNRRVCQAVINAGFIGARTTTQFHLNPGFDAWQIPTTIMVDPLPHWIRFRHELKTGNWSGVRTLLQRGISASWVELARGLFEDVLESGGVWHLWGHSWEIEKYDLWDDLRTVLNEVAQRKYVRYLTNTEVIRELG
jgi:peptidoglycan/xylan/chitin deacetylase (PgdA/CDA1 family)